MSPIQPRNILFKYLASLVSNLISYLTEKQISKLTNDYDTIIAEKDKVIEFKDSEISKFQGWQVFAAIK